MWRFKSYFMSWLTGPLHQWCLKHMVLTCLTRYHRQLGPKHIHILDTGIVVAYTWVTMPHNLQTKMIICLKSQARLLHTQHLYLNKCATWCKISLRAPGTGPIVLLNYLNVFPWHMWHPARDLVLQLIDALLFYISSVTRSYVFHWSW